MVPEKRFKSLFSITAAALAAAVFTAAPLISMPAHAQEEETAEAGSGGGSITVEGASIDVADEDGVQYVSLEKMAKKMGLSVKFYPDSNMYKLIDKKEGREIKFVVDKRAVVVGDKYFKSKDPVVKTEDDVRIPVEMLSQIYTVKAPAAKKQEAKKKEEAKKETAIPVEPEAQHEEIIVDEETLDTEDVHVVVNGDKKEGAEKPAAISETESETAESKVGETPNTAVIESIKYRRKKDAFELDVAFDRAVSENDVKFSVSPDNQSVDIQINKIDSKLGEQMIKVSENIVKNVKLTLAKQQDRAGKAILTISSGARVKVSSSAKGGVMTFVFNKIDDMAAPLIAEEPGAATTSQVSIGQPAAPKTPGPGQAPGETAAVETVKKPEPPADKSKNDVVVKLKNEDDLISGIENLNYIVAIDAGHGGEEFGVVSESRTKEKDVALDIAKRVKAIIDKTKLRGMLVRNGDYFMPAENRLKFVNTYDTRICVSIHLGSSPNTLANGAGVFYYDLGGGTAGPQIASSGAAAQDAAGIDAQVNEILNTLNSSKKTGDSKILAEKISESMSKKKSIKIRKVKGTIISGLSECMMPAVIVEAGFLTNHDDEKALLTDEYKNDLALAIFEGIKNYVMTIKK